LLSFIRLQNKKKGGNLSSPPWLAKGYGGTKKVHPSMHHPSTMVHWWVPVHSGPLNVKTSTQICSAFGGMLIECKRTCKAFQTRKCPNMWAFRFSKCPTSLLTFFFL